MSDSINEINIWDDSHSSRAAHLKASMRWWERSTEADTIMTFNNPESILIIDMKSN